MKSFRSFTAATNYSFDDIPFHKVDSIIKSPSGKVIFEQKGVEVPTFWSKTATDILAQKYFRKTGIPTHTKRVPES